MEGAPPLEDAVPLSSYTYYTTDEELDESSYYYTNPDVGPRDPPDIPPKIPASSPKLAPTSFADAQARYEAARAKKDDGSSTDNPLARPAPRSRPAAVGPAAVKPTPPSDGFNRLSLHASRIQPSMAAAAAEGSPAPVDTRHLTIMVTVYCALLLLAGIAGCITAAYLLRQDLDVGMGLANMPLPVAVFVFGCVMCLLAAFGSVAFHFEDRRGILQFGVLNVALFISVVIVGSIALAYHIKLDNRMNKGWLNATDCVRNTIQDKYKCCGYAGISDHPASLCLPLEEVDPASAECRPFILEEVGWRLDIFQGACAFAAVFSAIGCIVMYFFCIKVFNSGEVPSAPAVESFFSSRTKDAKVVPPPYSPHLTTVLMLHSALMLLLGITGVIIGFYLRNMGMDIAMGLANYPLPVAFIVFGFFMMVMSAAGTYASVARSPRSLFEYTFLIFLLFVAMVAVGSAGRYYEDRLGDKLGEGWLEADECARNEIQDRFGCCGYNTREDNPGPWGRGGEAPCLPIEQQDPASEPCKAAIIALVGRRFKLFGGAAAFGAVYTVIGLILGLTATAALLRQPTRKMTPSST